MASTTAPGHHGRNDSPGNRKRNERRYSGRLELAHATLILEHGPAGLLARIERCGGRTEYAGPFDDPGVMVERLREVCHD